jgi:hypothetical protein
VLAVLAGIWGWSTQPGFVRRSTVRMTFTLAQATASALASLAIEPEHEVDEPTRSPVFKSEIVAI